MWIGFSGCGEVPPGPRGSRDILSIERESAPRDASSCVREIYSRKSRQLCSLLCRVFGRRARSTSPRNPSAHRTEKWIGFCARSMCSPRERSIRREAGLFGSCAGWNVFRTARNAADRAPDAHDGPPLLRHPPGRCGQEDPDAVVTGTSGRTSTAGLLTTRAGVLYSVRPASMS